MTEKKQPKPTYALAMSGHAAFVLKLKSDGVEFEQAEPGITTAAIRLGVVCLNTGKTAKEIFAALEGLMP